MLLWTELSQADMSIEGRKSLPELPSIGTDDIAALNEYLVASSCLRNGASLEYIRQFMSITHCNIDVRVSTARDAAEARRKFFAKENLRGYERSEGGSAEEHKKLLPSQELKKHVFACLSCREWKIRCAYPAAEGPDPLCQ
jgi:hypothetical protein